MAQLRTRRPTCVPSWPLILLAGEPKSGKTWAAAQFTGDERVGRSFMLDLGEGTADEYGAVPGADYEIIDHNGTWIDIIDQVEAVRDVAKSELAAGKPPVCLIIDSMTAEWAMLSVWTDTRARRSKRNEALLKEDPDAEIDVGHMYWNDANSRHNRLMNILKTFPGIVIMTALESEKSQFGPDGKPLKIKGQPAPKKACPDAQKKLPADASAWIRLSLDSPPTVVGMRSVLKENITPGADKPQPWPDFTLAKLVFEFLGLGPGSAQARVIPALDADQHVDGEEQPTGPRAVRTAEQNEAYAMAGVEKLLGASMAPAAAELRKRAESDPAGQVDVREWVSDPVREVLDIPLDIAALTLVEFAETVVAYVARRSCSVASAIEDAA